MVFLNLALQTKLRGACVITAQVSRTRPLIPSRCSPVRQVFFHLHSPRPSGSLTVPRLLNVRGKGRSEGSDSVAGASPRKWQAPRGARTWGVVEGEVSESDGGGWEVEALAPRRAAPALLSGETCLLAVRAPRDGPCCCTWGPLFVLFLFVWFAPVAITPKVLLEARCKTPE